MYDNIKVTLDGGIATVVLDRPEKLNAFAGHMRRDLAEALEHAGGDRAVRVVVITGAGRGFCAGADVKFMDELMRRDDEEEFKRLLGAGRRVLISIRQMTKPVIASINGPAYGAGFNLALACDLRVAAETRRLAERLRDAPHASIAAAKHAVYMSHHAELEEMLQYETEAQLRCFQTTEARERAP